MSNWSTQKVQVPKKNLFSKKVSPFMFFFASETQKTEIRGKDPSKKSFSSKVVSFNVKKQLQQRKW